MSTQLESGLQSRNSVAQQGIGRKLTGSLLFLFLALIEGRKTDPIFTVHLTLCTGCERVSDEMYASSTKRLVRNESQIDGSLQAQKIQPSPGPNPPINLRQADRGV